MGNSSGNFVRKAFGRRASSGAVPKGFNNRRAQSSMLEQLEPRTLMSVSGFDLGSGLPSNLHHGADTHTTAKAATLAPPSSLHASALSSSAVKVSWTDNDTTATGYYVLRTADGVNWNTVGTLTSATAASFTDGTVAAGHGYGYEVKAFNSAVVSAASNIETLRVPAAAVVGAPSNLRDTHGKSAVNLSWTDTDSSANGYCVLRATDGVNFSTIATINSATAAAFVDGSVSSGRAYQYEVKAFKGTTLSGASNVDLVVTPLFSPTGLTATVSGVTVNLQWTNHDSAATGYAIFRATDGRTFTLLKSLTSGSANSYTDSAVAAGQTYTYQVRAMSAVSTSEPSNAAAATVPNGGGGGTGNGVSISTRYGNELVITAGGTADTVSVVQSGSTLTITADGTTSTATAPAAGVFVYARSGNDHITIDSSVLIRTTIDAIDGALTTIASAGANVSAWIDATDAFSGSGVVHRVASFLGGVGKGLGLSLANPTDAGPTTVVNRSLWGTGPVAADVNQGSLGDCYFLSTLAAFAGVKPAALQESAVDLGDGTFAVQFFRQGVANFVRVSDAFPTGGFGGFAFAHPGANNTIWAMVMEKAFAEFRTGANTYSSISGGWMGEVYNDLNTANASFTMSTQSETAFYNMVSAGLSSGKPVTVGTSDTTALVKSHAYTLVSASKDSNGVTHYVVRNPWGTAGDVLENTAGYATLTFAQMVADFGAGCIAV
jgi:fibronectin type 3 domain-containing protein